MVVPKHVAIILDGNGRWAAAKGMPREYGHVQGFSNVENTLRAAEDLGIKYVTVYAFSTENWNRPQKEVDALMSIFRKYLKTSIKTAKKNNMRVRVIGDVTAFDEDIQNRILDLEESTKEYTGLQFQIALSYGSRNEILRACKQIVKEVSSGELHLDDITENTISLHLDTKEIPDPDLLIRTSGEQRLSNYLLWQMAYTEFYFTNIHWPDFNKEELIKACEAFEQRKRRYGGIKERVEQ